MEGKAFGATGSGYPSGSFLFHCIPNRSHHEGVPGELYASRVWIPHIYPFQLEHHSEANSGKERCRRCVVGDGMEGEA